MRQKDIQTIMEKIEKFANIKGISVNEILEKEGAFGKIGKDCTASRDDCEKISSLARKLYNQLVFCEECDSPIDDVRKLVPPYGPRLIKCHICHNKQWFPPMAKDDPKCP